MQNGRFYLRVVTLASAMVLGQSAVGQTQPGADATSVNARATAVLADIEGRQGAAKTEDAKKCLRDKKNAVAGVKGRIAGGGDPSSLLAELNNIAGELDACTGEKGKDKDKDKGGSAGDTKVEMTLDEGTPGIDDNPSVIIPPGPVADGPGITDGTGGGDTAAIPNIPPPPVSPAM